MLKELYLSKGYLIILTFIISLIVFHYIAYRLKNKLTKRFWKFGDYFWLGLVIISLSTTVAGMRSMIIEPEIKIMKEKIQETLTDLPSNLANDDWIYDSAMRNLSMEKYKIANNPEFADKNTKEIIEYIEKLKLNPELKDELIEGFVFWDIKKYHLQNGIARLERRNSLNEELEKLESVAHRKEHEKLLLLIGPIILAIAAGIRITMTSVEIYNWHKDKNIKPRYRLTWRFTGPQSLSSPLPGNNSGESVHESNQANSSA